MSGNGIRVYDKWKSGIFQLIVRALWWFCMLMAYAVGYHSMYGFSIICHAMRKFMEKGITCGMVKVEACYKLWKIYVKTYDNCQIKKFTHFSQKILSS